MKCFVFFASLMGLFAQAEKCSEVLSSVEHRIEEVTGVVVKYEDLDGLAGGLLYNALKIEKSLSSDMRLEALRHESRHIFRRAQFMKGNTSSFDGLIIARKEFASKLFQEILHDRPQFKNNALEFQKAFDKIYSENLLMDEVVVYKRQAIDSLSAYRLEPKENGKKRRTLLKSSEANILFSEALALYKLRLIVESYMDFNSSFKMFKSDPYFPKSKRDFGFIAKTINKGTKEEFVLLFPSLSVEASPGKFSNQKIATLQNALISQLKKIEEIKLKVQAEIKKQEIDTAGE